MSQNTLIHQGAMYVRVCGVPVANVEGGMTTTCMKRNDHPGKLHEDFDGRTRHEVFGPGVSVLTIPEPRVLTAGGASVNREMIQAVWDGFVKPTQDAQDDQSPEMQTLMAVLRSVAEGLPQPEAPAPTEEKKEET